MKMDGIMKQYASSVSVEVTEIPKVDYPPVRRQIYDWKVVLILKQIDLLLSWFWTSTILNFNIPVISNCRKDSPYVFFSLQFILSQICNSQSIYFVSAILFKSEVLSTYYFSVSVSTFFIYIMYINLRWNSC